MRRKMQNIQGAIFDMDGTLIDSLMLWEMLWKRFGEIYLNGDAFAPPAEEDKAIRTMPLREAMEYLHENCGIGEDGEALFSIVIEVFHNFYKYEVQLKKGVKEFLEDCSGKGIPMCIASATDPELVVSALKHCGIEHYFKKICSCADLGKGKECPDIYMMARECLGTPLEETWVFEDAGLALTTASAAGFPTVGIYDAHNYGQDIVKDKATIYIGEGETLVKLIDPAEK